MKMWTISRRSFLGGVAATGLILPRAALPAAPAARTLPPAGDRGFAPRGYQLVFEDDFDDPDLRRINENALYGKRGAPAWRSRYRHGRDDVINEEKQIYMDVEFAGTRGRPLGVQPFSIRDSVLRIEANRADPVRVKPYIWDYDYTSGVISSELTFWQTYGYFEMRAKMPAGRGFWPAFWLVAKRDAWPPELDIFECFGHKPDVVRHGVLGNDVLDESSDQKSEGKDVTSMVNVTDGFHCYAMEWTRTDNIFYINGTETFRAKNFVHEAMFLQANLAIGSADEYWVPNPDRTTPFPSHFEIDYIRAYRKA